MGKAGQDSGESSALRTREAGHRTKGVPPASRMETVLRRAPGRVAAKSSLLEGCWPMPRAAASSPFRHTHVPAAVVHALDELAASREAVHKILGLADINFVHEPTC